MRSIAYPYSECQVSGRREAVKDAHKSDNPACRRQHGQIDVYTCLVHSVPRQRAYLLTLYIVRR